MTDYSQARAVVVGGSIGGLTTALLLRDSGFHVDVFERTPTALDGRGSGIVLQPDTVRWFQERSSQDLGDLQTATRFVQYLDRSGDVASARKHVREGVETCPEELGIGAADLELLEQRLRSRHVVTTPQAVA